MATITFTITPKTISGKDAIDHHAVAEGIKIRVMGVDWKKTRDLVNLEIINELTKYMSDKVKAGTAKKEVTGVPEKKYSGKHEMFVYVNKNKATKIELEIDPEPKFDIAKECPLFATGTQTKGSGEYWGGAANQPHVHVYSGGFHLKLSDRYNIVQDGKLYAEGIKKAHEALKGHGLKDTLLPFVRAALKQHGLIS